jgi:hypothetical protein
VGTFGNEFADGDGWGNWWGAMSENGGVLTVGASASTTGGGALLEGSNSWSDYTFQANVDWIKGETFGLVARYVDPGDYLLCDFDEPAPGTVYMSLRQYVNGVGTNLATGDVPNYEQVGGVGIDAILEVSGGQASCSFNGTVVSTFDLSAASNIQSGEIGFTTWDAAMDNSEIIVHTIGVSSGAYDLAS